jgi:hypothetical protein
MLNLKIFELNEEELISREFKIIDISNINEKDENYKKEEDPRIKELKEFNIKGLNDKWIENTENLIYIHKIWFNFI